MEKIDLRSVLDYERHIIRRDAVKMIKRGDKKKDVAKFYGVHVNTVRDWWKLYKKEGKKSLTYKKRGVKSEDRKLLNTEQELEIQKMITDTMPDQLKLDFALWTTKAIKELIMREFTICIGRRAIGNYLKNWGFTPQKPKKRAYEQSSTKVKRWLEEEYPLIKKKAKEQKATIHWGDETGVRNTNQHGRSFAPKGKTPIKKHMSKRFSINMISTVTNQGLVQFMIYKENMNADVLIKFLNQLIKRQDNKVFLILDNLRVHHSKIVKKWEQEHKTEIELFYLPSYSPDRNPDEYLNCDLKYGLSEKPAPKTVEKLKENLENHMSMLQENSHRVAKYFKHPAIKYAA
ncbi:Mobile element protein [hydrothermal vent metagenome]|uniref:Mobile element protein n=1 Tax=hydrothermal vent metagenome TaxID=652676 RepID=A0A3B0W4R9_9ZZZZ